MGPKSDAQCVLPRFDIASRNIAHEVAETVDMDDLALDLIRTFAGGNFVQSYGIRNRRPYFAQV